MDYEKLNAQYRAEEQWPSVTDPALGIEPCNVESQARSVGEWAASRIESLADNFRKQLDEVSSRNYQLRMSLAASQAREAQMREVLESIREYWNGDNNETAMYDACFYAEQKADEALALPNDTTVLDARIKAERAKERERCGKAFSERGQMNLSERVYVCQFLQQLGDE